eukprot:6184951-Pleurochrysis_carterae.AAC.1
MHASRGKEGACGRWMRGGEVSRSIGVPPPPARARAVQRQRRRFVCTGGALNEHAHAPTRAQSSVLHAARSAPRRSRGKADSRTQAGPTRKTCQVQRFVLVY